MHYNVIRKQEERDLKGTGTEELSLTGDPESASDKEDSEQSGVSREQEDRSGKPVESVEREV